MERKIKSREIMNVYLEALKYGEDLHMRNHVNEGLLEVFITMGRRYKGMREKTIAWFIRSTE